MFVFSNRLTDLNYGKMWIAPIPGNGSTYRQVFNIGRGPVPQVVKSEVTKLWNQLIPAVKTYLEKQPAACQKT
jgi:hypothetical protein